MADSNRESTFGRNLMKFISSNLPYQSVDTSAKINALNPKYELFYNQGTKVEDALSRQSISNSPTYSEDLFANVLRNRDFHDFMYANIQPDKSRRLMDYRVMAAFAEVADALDEICDEFVNKDEQGEIVKVVFKDTSISEQQKNEIRKEFQKYIGFFHLDQKGWEYCRNLLVDSELYWEHIIHKDYKDRGILGILQVPSDTMDPVYQNVQNLKVKGYLLRKPVYDSKNPGKIVKTELVPMDMNQVTYVNSGIWNESKTIRLPFIENARRAYRQLSLIEDSIVIYRLVRAPERLVFNVDVGNMPPPKAEAYLRKLMTQYWSKRTFDADQNAAVQKFNPQSMLDSFWFAKRTGSEGTNVTSLPGGQNLGELADLIYFVKKLYKSLKVPVNRLNPEDTYNDGANILREELKFARFVIRLQQRFASGIKPGFYTHLKLKGIADKVGIREDGFELTFNVPTNFYELRESQKFQIKAENFNSITQSDLISKTYAQKRYLGWTDTDVMANREFLRKDKELQWELAQIENNGPNWREAGATVPGENGSEAGMGGGTAPAGGPPAFGPAPGAPEAEGEASGEGGGEAGGVAAPAPETAGGGEASALPK